MVRNRINYYYVLLSIDAVHSVHWAQAMSELLGSILDLRRDLVSQLEQSLFVHAVASGREATSNGETINLYQERSMINEPVPFEVSAF